MAKQSVLVVGHHFSGKSKTINQYLKPLLKIGPHAHIFSINGWRGFVLSQSSEESNQNVQQLIEKYSHFDLFVLACRPETDEHSNLKAAQIALKKASFKVDVVAVRSHEEAPDKAREIFDLLSSK